MRNGLFAERAGSVRRRWRHEAHVDRHMAAARYDVGAVAPFDLSERDCRASQLGMLGQLIHGIAYIRDGLCHAGNRIGALPGRACMRRDTAHIKLEPGTSLVRLTDEAVCGLAVEDPAVAPEPASVDGSLDITHEVLFVDCADKGKGALREPALPAYGVQKVARCKKGAGKATLHVAGPSAIEPAIFVAIVFGIFLKQIRKLFPPVVTGTVVFCIGLSLYTVAIGYMAGGKGSANFGSAQNWIVAIITLVACVYFDNFTKGVTKLGSLLFGMLVGYAVALCFSMVDFSDVASAGWFQLPTVMPFEVKFLPSAIASISIIYVAASVQAIGDFSGASMGGMDRGPTDQELAGGIISQGILSIVGAVFGALPTSTYGQNVGIVTQTRVINKHVFTAAAPILIAVGLMPKLAAVLSDIPQAVIGDATVNVFSTITMTGIRILSQKGLTPRNASIAGLLVALGMGIAMTDGCLAGPGMPEWISSVFGDSAMIVTAIVAIIPNLVLSKGGPDSDVVEAVKGAQQIAREGVSALYESAAKGTPAVELQQEKMEKQKKE